MALTEEVPKKSRSIKSLAANFEKPKSKVERIAAKFQGEQLSNGQRSPPKIPSPPGSQYARSSSDNAVPRESLSGLKESPQRRSPGSRSTPGSSASHGSSTTPRGSSSTPGSNSTPRGSSSSSSSSNSTPRSSSTPGSSSTPRGSSSTPPDMAAVTPSKKPSVGVGKLWEDKFSPEAQTSKASTAAGGVHASVQRQGSEKDMAIQREQAVPVPTPAAEPAASSAPGSVGEQEEQDLTKCQVEGVEGLEGMTMDEVQRLFEALEGETGETGETGEEPGNVSSPGQAAMTSVADKDGEEKGKASPDSKPEVSLKEVVSPTIPPLSSRPSSKDPSKKNPSQGEEPAPVKKPAKNPTVATTPLMSEDPGHLETDIAARKAELAQLETEVERRRGDLSKLRVDLASATSEKVQTDSALTRLKREFRDWSETVDEVAWKTQEVAAEAAELQLLHETNSTGRAAELTATVVKAKLQRARDEILVLRKRESSVQQDVEYLERKYASEKRDAMEAKRRLGEMKAGRRDAERELQRLRPEVVLLRKTTQTLQRRLVQEEEDALLLRRQLQKAQTAEIELLEQVQLATRESSALRKAALWSKEAREDTGDWDSELQRQLGEQMQRNADLETKCAEQARSLLQLEMRTGEAERLKAQAQRALEQGQMELGLTQAAQQQQLSVEVASEEGDRDSEEGSRHSRSQSLASVALPGGVPDRVWNLLDQVEATKTSGMGEKDELVRLHWLTTCIQEELQKARHAGPGLKPDWSGAAAGAEMKIRRSASTTSVDYSSSSSTSSAAAAAAAAAVRQDPGAAVPALVPMGPMGVKKTTHRSLSSVIRLPGSAIKRTGSMERLPESLSKGLMVEVPSCATADPSHTPRGVCETPGSAKSASANQPDSISQPSTPAGGPASARFQEPKSPAAKGRFTRWLSKPADRGSQGESGNPGYESDATTPRSSAPKRSMTMKVGFKK